MSHKAEIACEGVRAGDDLTVALGKCHIFPVAFLNIVASAEEAGHRMTILTRAASWGVYAVVAALIIFMIFRIFSTYIGMLDPAQYGI
jgi:type II secretory pathway component PulF